MRIGIVVLAACLAFGCGKKEEPPPRDLGQQAADLAADTQTMREASDAANEVIRNAADCEAARPLIAGANAKVDEAARRVRTATGRQTLDALRIQIKRVADLCP